MKRRLLQAALLLLLVGVPRGVMGAVYVCSDFYLFDDADFAKRLQFDASGVQTGTTVIIKAPNYSGTGVVPLPADEGGTNYLLMSSGASVAPVWDNTHLAYSGGLALTAGRVPFAASGNALTDDADLTFGTDSLSATKLRTQSLRVQAHVLPGAGMQHCRVNTGTIGAGSTAQITITWGVAFADTNYTVVAQVEDATASSLSLSVVHIDSRTATDCKVRILNNAITGLVGLIHAIALHD